MPRESWNRKNLDEKFIYNEYFINKTSAIKIASRMGVSPKAVYRRLKIMGKVRDNSESHTEMRSIWQEGPTKNAG